MKLLNTKKKSILCVGESVIDYIAQTFALPQKDQTVFIEHASRSIGGGSMDSAIMLSQLGLHTTLLSYGGGNFFRLSDELRHYSLDFSLFQKVQRDSGSVFVFFDQDHYMTFFDPGDEEDFVPQKVPLDPSAFSAFCLIGSRYSSFRQFYVQLLENGVSDGHVVLFSPAWSVDLFSTEQLQRILRKTNILVVNEQEFGALLHLFSDCTALFEFGPRIIIKTLGAEGCQILYPDKQTVHVPAIPGRDIKNPSGAGDAFIAGFLFGLFNGYDDQQSAQFGSTVASFVVEVPQSYCSITLPDVFMRWQRFFHD